MLKPTRVLGCFKKSFAYGDTMPACPPFPTNRKLEFSQNLTIVRFQRTGNWHTIVWTRKRTRGSNSSGSPTNFHNPKAVLPRPVGQIKTPTTRSETFFSVLPRPPWEIVEPAQHSRRIRRVCHWLAQTWRLWNCAQNLVMSIIRDLTRAMV